MDKMQHPDLKSIIQSPDFCTNNARGLMNILNGVYANSMGKNKLQRREYINVCNSFFFLIHVRDTSAWKKTNFHLRSLLLLSKIYINNERDIININFVISQSTFKEQKIKRKFTFHATKIKIYYNEIIIEVSQFVRQKKHYWLRILN